MKILLKISSPILLLLTCLHSPLGWTLSSDFEQPIDIEADQVTLDADSNSSIYSGNVLLTRGTIKITADKLIISQKQDNRIDAIILGSPAKYSQMAENNTPISGNAKKITYSNHLDIVELSGNAVLNRGGNQINSEQIKYNIRDNTISAGSEKQDDKPVKIRIMPNTP